MRQRTHNTTEHGQVPIVTFDALAQFSNDMRRQEDSRLDTYVLKNNDYADEFEQDDTPDECLAASSYLTTVTPPPAGTKKLSKLLSDDLPSENSNEKNVNITIQDLYNRYDPSRRNPQIDRNLPELGAVTNFTGDIELQKFAIAFTTIPTPLWRKVLWAWRWDRWPVDVYIEFTGRKVDDPSETPLYICFGLNAEKALPMITIYRDKSTIPNEAGLGTSKMRIPMRNNQHTCELYLYCQEMASKHNTNFAYVNRAEDFCERHVPCCGEALGALFLSWSTRRSPVSPCLDLTCLPIVNPETRRSYTDTGGEVWTAARLVYSALWSTVFMQHLNFCSTHGFTEQPPASIHAFFNHLMNMKTHTTAS